jgi:uncharacterized protein YgbK (DUF1537 family)
MYALQTRTAKPQNIAKKAKISLLELEKKLANFLFMYCKRQRSM